MSFRFLWLKGHALIALIFTIVCFSNRPRRLGYNESPLHPDSSHLYKRAPKRLIGKFCPRHATSRATIASGPTTRTNAHSCAVLRKKTEKRDRERAREREREREGGLPPCRLHSRSIDLAGGALPKLWRKRDALNRLIPGSFGPTVCYARALKVDFRKRFISPLRDR
jgi:hypothetical protein